MSLNNLFGFGHSTSMPSTFTTSDTITFQQPGQVIWIDDLNPEKLSDLEIAVKKKLKTEKQLNERSRLHALHYG